MTTTFALLCQLGGLSQREAATFLKVRPDTVKSWSAGRNRTPPGVIATLAELAERIDAAADEAVEEIEQRMEVAGAAPGVIELGLAGDDREAQSLGWPCIGTHRAVIALTAARALNLLAFEGHATRVEIVPRGSTPATRPMV